MFLGAHIQCRLNPKYFDDPSLISRLLGSERDNLANRRRSGISYAATQLLACAAETHSPSIVTRHRGNPTRARAFPHDISCVTAWRSKTCIRDFAISAQSIFFPILPGVECIAISLVHISMGPSIISMWPARFLSVLLTDGVAFRSK